LTGETSRYVGAGVDIQAANRIVELIKKHAASTYRPGVLAPVGLFGGLFQLTGFKQPVLVASADGVGTKLKVAAALDSYYTVGIDIVNHSVNDILTLGAEPLFFLDYVAMGRLVPEQVEAIVRGLSQACRDVGCSLIGGETAEMPGLYAEGDYDLVGFIVGAVEKDKVIDGQGIRAGDALLGLPSSGLHTNGYSLVRRVFQIRGKEDAFRLRQYHPEVGRSLAEELLEPHRCYYDDLKLLLPLVKGLAHITGGGFMDNLPRILPKGLAVNIQVGSWTVPPIFSLIQKLGQVDQAEMYHVFNMGIGMVIICANETVSRLAQALPLAKVIGWVVPQAGENRVTVKS
jgi:phosphoribosylformylglycinamidine cyclo-ligase